MADACLRTQTNYLDVTGEVAVFEELVLRDAAAKRSGVTLLPGVGFDVVPSDCLAAHLKRRLPSATHLRLAFQMTMALSRGTALSTIEGLGLPNQVRRGGVLTPVPMGELSREIDFGQGPTIAVSIPWGDVSTAYFSTAIPNIEVYVAVPPVVRLGMKLSGLLAPVLQSAPVQSFSKARVRSGRAGPSAEERRRGRAWLWGEVENGAGDRATSRLETPEGYTLTVETALASLERVLRGEAAPGFQTPSKVFGPDFILSMPDVRRSDS
jgi:short subunit dehydrogenase-like uncharacterized protein